MDSLQFRMARELPILQTPHYQVQFGKQSKKGNRHDCRLLFERQFACSEIMYAFMDMIQWILFRSYQRQLNPLKIPMVSSELFHPFLLESLHIKKFGQKSTSGFVRWSEILKDRFPVIIKTTQKKGNVSQMEDLIHEYIVSLYALNGLRESIPHFSFAFAIYCDPQYSLSLAMEWIPNGMTLSAYLDQQLSLRWKEELSLEWISLFMQIIFALEIAQEQCWFTHYDLHADNIILRENNKSSYVPEFSIFHETYKWSSSPNYIPTLIDFAHASVTDKPSRMLIGKRGKASFPEYGMYSSYLPGADMLKLILYLYNRYLSEKTYDPISMAERIFRPFIMWILRQFFQIVLDDKKIKQKFLQDIRMNIYNMTRYSIIYYSPYDLIQFLEQDSLTTCRILRISKLPWKKSLRSIQKLSSSFSEKWKQCFLTQFCSILQPIHSPRLSLSKSKSTVSISPNELRQLEDYLRQRHHFQYPLFHTSHFHEIMDLVNSPLSKSFLQISDQIMDMDHLEIGDPIHQWFQSPWKKAWIYHYRVLVSLSQFVNVFLTTLKLPEPKVKN